MPSAAAQDLPARFSVTDVPPGDRLNIREAPSASARILGSFQPGATGIEVIAKSPDGRWGLVPLAEGAGWVAMRYLRAEPPSATPLPRPLYCRGTEPFWSVSVTAEGALFERPDQDVIRLRQHGEVAGLTGGVMAFDAGGETLDLTVIRARCSDGMSDRPYGLQAMVWNRGALFLEGCCTLTAR
ncbi:Bacterial SH3 domain protein [Rubellimicrobium thermophilum DSM 16684]|uniref:Bacterial SH3 domain protein n=1 Tax=Rubellimicrobium thermophilum DSM 16684 TaxID=1123069 RepID=S9SM85_9RHOB|nr:SH3 domain-containing protein [Rubellimicrobium thermophilum]EPX87519.1 Bacterial SH3 domain protein [Rubellimicrobium thermophilum DSM 16684]